MPEAELALTPDLEQDLALLTEAVTEAGQLARSYFGKAPQVWDKEDNAGPVTAADLAVDQFLRDHLTAARPGTGWLSEESADEPGRAEMDEVFVLDPIDGTRSFIAEQPDWAISLALVRRGEVVAGVVQLPSRGLTFSAHAAGPALLNGQTIGVSQQCGFDGAKILASRRMLEAEWPGRSLPFKPQFRPSLAYRLALVAEGQFDAMLKTGLTWEWDVAAGSLIAARAGAQVGTTSGEMPQFNSPRRWIDGIVAATPGVYQPLLAALAPDGGAEPVGSV